MAKTLTLREANQGFAAHVRAVEAGEEFTITRNGVPVARLVPVARDAWMSPARQAAWARTRARMAHGWHLGGEKFPDRAGLHER